MNLSVGLICSSTIARTLGAAYYPLMPHELGREVVRTRFIVPAIARDRRTQKAWLDKHGSTPLYELQIEMCEWSIDELAKMVKDDEVPEKEGNTHRYGRLGQRSMK